MPTQAKKYGQYAEQFACSYLQEQSLSLIEKNYRSKYGEIDLIMQDVHHIVFIEVRARKKDHYGSALESITKTKRQKIIKTALCFLQEKNWINKMNCRFDVVVFDEKNIEWFKNAFSVEFC